MIGVFDVWLIKILQLGVSINLMVNYERKVRWIFP